MRAKALGYLGDKRQTAISKQASCITADAESR